MAKGIKALKLAATAVWDSLDAYKPNKYLHHLLYPLLHFLLCHLPSFLSNACCGFPTSCYVKPTWRSCPSGNSLVLTVACPKSYFQTSFHFCLLISCCFVHIFSSIRLRKINSGFFKIYDWKSLRFWLNSVCTAQIKSFYIIIRYKSVMVRLNGCYSVFTSLHDPGHVCVPVHWRKQAESYTSPILCCPAPSGTLRKSSACAVGTARTAGNTTKVTVFAHWVGCCHYCASSACWIVFMLHSRAHDSGYVENSETPPSLCLQQSGRAES